MADDAHETVAAAAPGVLLVVDDESLERFGAVTKHIVVGLADAAVRVTALCRTVRAPGALQLGPCQVIHSPPPRWRRGAHLPASVEDLLREGRVEVVHCLSIAQAGWIAGLKAFDRFPVAGHITDDVDLRLLPAVAKARARMWGLPASVSLFKRVIDLRCLSVRYNKLIRPGTIPQAAPPPFPPDAQIHSAILLTPLARDCGLDDVLRAMRRVRDGGRQVALFVLGKGPAERRYRHLAEELGLAGAVTFVGALSHWVPAMTGCDIVLIPRPGARWTSQVLESMAAGRVVLAPRQDSEDDLVDGKTGALFDHRRVDDLAARWDRLLADPDRSRSIGAAAQAAVRKHHSPSGMAEGLLELYTDAVADAPSRVATADKRP